MYLPLNFCRTPWTLWAFSAPAAHAKTPLFTAREPLWRSKWPLGPAWVLLGRSGLPGCCWSALKGCSGLLRRRQSAQNGRSGLPRCRQCAQKGCSSLLRCCQCAQNGHSGLLWCHQCAQKACSSPLQCTECAQRGCSSLLCEITIRKCWSRFHFALNNCTLLCFTLCMDMHGFTLV